jgi:hypothetical protein
MKPLVMMMSASLVALALSGGAWAAGSTALDPAKIEAAKTPAEHEAIAKAYEAEALSIEKMAEMHKNLAETYGQPGGKPWQAKQAKHCDSVAASLKTAAQEERALAAEHHKMAKEAGQ